MDKTTFGNSQAAINLISILEALGEEGRSARSSASRLICNFNATLWALWRIPDPKLRSHLRNATKKSTLELLANSPVLTEGVESHVRTVLITSWKIHLHLERWQKSKRPFIGGPIQDDAFISDRKILEREKKNRNSNYAAVV